MDYFFPNPEEYRAGCGYDYLHSPELWVKIQNVPILTKHSHQEIRYSNGFLSRVPASTRVLIPKSQASRKNYFHSVVNVICTSSPYRSLMRQSVLHIHPSGINIVNVSSLGYVRLAIDLSRNESTR